MRSATGIILLLLLIVVAILYGFNGLYGQDAHEYLRMSRELHDVFSGGREMSDSIFPILFPFMGFLLSKIIPNDVIALQAVSMISFSVAFYFIVKIIGLLYENKPRTVWYTGLFLAVSPYVFRFGLLSMSDMLCLMLIVLALYSMVSFILRKKKYHAVLALFFCSAALATRYAVSPIVIPLMIVTGIIMIRRKDWRNLFLAALCAVVPLLPDWFLRHRLLFLKFDDGRFSVGYGSNAYAWSPLNFFRSDFINVDGVQHYDQWNIVYAFFNIIHPAFLFTGVVFLFFIRKSDWETGLSKLFISIILLYALFLAGLPYQSNRYLLQSFPLVIIFLYPAFIRMSERLFRRRSVVIAAVVSTVLLQAALFIYSFQSVHELNQTEKHISAIVKKYDPPVVYTTSITPALQSYGVKNTKDLFMERISSVEPGSYLLFNETQFSEHFEGKKPMMNYDFIRSHYHLILVDSMFDGWKLFRVEP